MRRGERGVVAALCAGALIAASCTSGQAPPELRPPEAFLEQFVAEWNAGDFRAMAKSFDELTARLWPERRLSRFVETRLEEGEISGFEVELGSSSAITEPRSSPSPGDEVSVKVPYAIAYESDAAAGLVSLEGVLELVHGGDAQGWGVVWRKSLLWPGLERAAGFDVLVRWPRRGAIRDRRGRVLARGNALRRVYPFGTTGGAIVGHIGTLSRAEAPALGPHYAFGDGAGGSGLELGLERRLAGSPAVTLRVVDREGESVATLSRVPADPGRSVRTTLDIDVQRATEFAFAPTSGGAVVLDPRSGDILAAAGAVAFDPNRYVGVRGADPFDRSLEGLYPPGSSMKVVTASAALETGVVTPKTILSGPKEYRGVRNFESEQFATLTFATALQHSVNTAFAQVAQRLGPRRLNHFAEAFGFNDTPDLELHIAESSFPYPAEDYDLLWGAIGQARVLATPLQMATVAATIANDGKRMTPRIARVSRPSGERVVSRQTAGRMTALMVSVVEGGTGVNAAIEGVQVAGKTGTAEVDVDGKRKNHAWFVAFAPADRPRVAIAVVSEYGGIGGEVAAPIARRILTAVLPLVP